MPPKIEEVITLPIEGAYYCEDRATLEWQPMPLHERYTKSGMSPGHAHIRMVAGAITIGLHVQDGPWIWGDCAPLCPADLLPGASLAQSAQTLQQELKNILLDHAIDDDACFEPPLESLEARWPNGVRYGLSQALCKLDAWRQGITLAQALAQALQLQVAARPSPLLSLALEPWQSSADRMIARRACGLGLSLTPLRHWLANDSKLTPLTQVRWLRQRLQTWNLEGYEPQIYIEDNGWIGQESGDDLGQVLGVLYALERAAGPMRIWVQDPVHRPDPDQQRERMATLRDYIRFRGLNVQLVAQAHIQSMQGLQAYMQAQAAHAVRIDPHHWGSLQSSLEAMRHARQAGLGVILGGSIAETALSAQACSHLSLAGQPDLTLAKPGAGLDAGLALMQNEMVRALAQHKAAHAN